MRVRTDDLESVRVERAIKRVRSDLAAHVGFDKDKENIPTNSIKGYSAAPSETGSVLEEKVNLHEVHEAEDDVSSLKGLETHGKEDDHEEVNGDVVVDNGIDNGSRTSLEAQVAHDVPNLPEQAAEPSDDGQTEETPATPVASDHPARIPRSQSADFGKSRLGRAFTSSAPSQDGASSQTGDESSVSTTGGSRRPSTRKKRSISTAPKEPRKSHRKVVIDDFEMMRVLGKGCAGKVLLVKQKTTSELYALKAITKRHVLAHQELQHTLTEQAVLKRMAAESRDPFVVKLWWSFHDKENLFLVMVSYIHAL